MIENINKAVSWVKEQKLEGCITGSVLLGYFPNQKQDIDFFAFTEQSFTQMFYAMYYNKMFTILDPLEKWKSNRFRTEKNKFSKMGIQTIKFYFNTCIEVNLVYKPGCTNSFSVLSSFDMDIICKSYDTFLQKELDLTEGSTITKEASWNTWNTTFYKEEDWDMRRVLRQMERVFKYHSRGYNTDKVVLKYIEIIEKYQKLEDIFHSSDYTEKLENNKAVTRTIKILCENWLENHTITEEELELLKTKIREI